MITNSLMKQYNIQPDIIGRLSQNFQRDAWIDDKFTENDYRNQDLNGHKEQYVTEEISE